MLQKLRKDIQEEYEQGQAPKPRLQKATLKQSTFKQEKCPEDMGDVQTQDGESPVCPQPPWVLLARTSLVWCEVPTCSWRILTNHNQMSVSVAFHSSRSFGTHVQVYETRLLCNLNGVRRGTHSKFKFGVACHDEANHLYSDWIWGVRYGPGNAVQIIGYGWQNPSLIAWFPLHVERCTAQSGGIATRHLVKLSTIMESSLKTWPRASGVSFYQSCRHSCSL